MARPGTAVNLAMSAFLQFDAYVRDLYRVGNSMVLPGFIAWVAAQRNRCLRPRMSNKPPSVDQALTKAKILAKKGAPDQAMQLYRTVLQRFPGNKRAIEGLKSLTRPKHNQEPVALDERRMQEQINGLIELYNQGRFPEALERGTALAAQHPNVPLILNILGAVNAGLGRLDQAVASYTKALRIKPGYAEAHNNLGTVFIDMGKHKEAVASLTRAVQLSPGYAEAHNNLGNALKAIGKSEEAIASYTKALQIKPDVSEMYSNLGTVLIDLGKHEEAIANLTKALQLRPDFAEAHNNLGTALKAIGKSEEAIASYAKALQIKPAFAEAHSNLGTVLVDIGKHEEAVASLTKALKLRPDYTEAWRSLGIVKKYKIDDPQIAQMREKVANPLASDNEKINLSFALGKAYDDIGDAENSVKHFLEGNRLRKKELGYDISFDRRLFGLIKSIFEADELPTVDAIQPARERKKRPIFIVGMLRSGTTLTEQILASHLQVYGAGEIDVMNRAVLSVLDEIQKVHAGKLNSAVLEAIRGRYFMEVDGLGGGEPYITDKMPLNFMFIGFILTAVPEAKIINLQRDPVATCWSIFTHYFSGTGNGYAYDLVDVAEFYKLYSDLMAFWRERFPNQINDLNYESLTENQEEETQKLLKFCGLDWEDRCLEFHKTKRAVKTSSSVQVRQEMYKGSSEAWRKYEAHMQPMLQALKGFY